MSDVDLDLLDDSEEDDDSTTLDEGQIYDFISGEPVKDSPTERIVQSIARSLVNEYGFDLDQIEREYKIVYEVYKEDGKTKKVRPKVSMEASALSKYQMISSVHMMNCSCQRGNRLATHPEVGAYTRENWKMDQSAA